MERALPCLQVSEGRSGESTGIWGFNHERSSFKNCSVSRTIGLIILSMFGQNPVPVTRYPYPSLLVAGGGGGHSMLLRLLGRQAAEQGSLVEQGLRRSRDHQRPAGPGSPRGWREERLVGSAVPGWGRLVLVGRLQSSVKLNSASSTFLRGDAASKVLLLLGAGWSRNRPGSRPAPARPR